MTQAVLGVRRHSVSVCLSVFAIPTDKLSPNRQRLPQWPGGMEAAVRPLGDQDQHLGLLFAQFSWGKEGFFSGSSSCRGSLFFPPQGAAPHAAFPSSGDKPPPPPAPPRGVRAGPPRSCRAVAGAGSSGAAASSPHTGPAAAGRGALASCPLPRVAGPVPPPRCGRPGQPRPCRPMEDEDGYVALDRRGERGSAGSCPSRQGAGTGGRVRWDPPVVWVRPRDRVGVTKDPGRVQGCHRGGWGSQKDLERRSQRSLGRWGHGWGPWGQETWNTIRGNRGVLSAPPQELQQVGKVTPARGSRCSSDGMWALGTSGSTSRGDFHSHACQRGRNSGRGSERGVQAQRGQVTGGFA